MGGWPCSEYGKTHCGKKKHDGKKKTNFYCDTIYYKNDCANFNGNSQALSSLETIATYGPQTRLK